MIPRTRLAAVVAPPAAMLVFWAGSFLATAATAAEPLPRGAAGHTLVLFLFFGVPLTYMGAALLALPAYTALARRGRLSRRTVVATASLLGAAWAPLVVAALAGDLPSSGDATFFAAVCLLGGLAGATGGAVFAVLAVGRRPARPAGAQLTSR